MASCGLVRNSHWNHRRPDWGLEVTSLRAAEGAEHRGKASQGAHMTGPHTGEGHSLLSRVSAVIL